MAKTSPTQSLLAEVRALIDRASEQLTRSEFKAFLEEVSADIEGAIDGN